MRSTLFTFFILLFLQACQVSEKVVSSKELTINNYPLTDFQVVLSPDGWKKLGSTISIKLVHAHELTVVGTPFIEVMVGNQVQNFTYQSGSGTDTLVFGYTVTSSDEDDNGIQILNTIQLNGGSITYIDATGVATNTVTSFNPPAYDIRVDGVIPTLLSVKGPNSGNYITNSNLNYAIRFSENVFVSGSPKIDIGLGTGTVSAKYSGGTGSRVLTFGYKILSSDYDNDGFINASSITLSPSSNITITDQAGNSISSSIPVLSSQSILTDYRLTQIVSVTPATLTGLAIAQPVDFTIRFAEPMAFIPSAKISLLLPSGMITANYLSGSGSTDVKFRYLVQNGLENFSNISLLTPVEVTSTNNIYINSAVPTIMSVTSPAATTYHLGQNIDFTVLFSSPVNVTGLPAIPLTLTTGPVKAKYLSGTGTNTLIFRYTVEAEKQDLDGISVGSQLELLGGTIKDLTNTFSSQLALPTVVTTGVFVDSIAGPSVLFAYAPAAAVYTEGQNLDFTLVFNRAVTFSGTPRLPVNLGGVIPTTVNATFQPALSSGNTAVFRYTVQVGDNDSDGLTITDPIDLNSGSIVDSLGLAANLYYSAPNMTGIFVDGLAPSILSLTAPASATYGPGQILTFIATYNEVVNVTGIPTIAITLTTGTVYAQYATGSGTNTLNFTYQVQAGDQDADGITLISPLSVSSATIKDNVSHPQSPLTFTVPSTTGILIDGSAPSITAMTVSPTTGTVILGQSITFTTTWSEAVTFSGNPRIVLNIGGTLAYANFQSCSSTTSCSFKYSVSAGHLDTNGITLNATSIDASLGTIKDASGNDANLNVASVVPTMTSLNVDGVAPTISSVVVSTSTNHTYIIGQNIDFTVTWSEPVTVSGASYLSVVVGSQTLSATGVSGNGTSTHVYRYTVASGHLDNDGINLHSTVYPSGGSLIHDANWNTANLSFTPPQMNLVTVDGVLPTIGLITPPNNDTYHLGELLTFTFNWSEPITVNTSGGTPTLNIILSGSAMVKIASYNSLMSTPTKMVFSYTVASGDLDADGIQIDPQIYLNGAVITDSPGNLAATPISFNSPVLSGVKVDGVRPIITSMTPPPDGYYGVGSNVNFTLHFSEAITVTGSPYVQIKFGSTYKNAYYSSGSMTNDIVFTYTVGVTNNGLNAGTTFYSPVILNGGTLQDGPGNDAVLTFAGSTYAGVVVDGVLPVASSAVSENLTSTSNHASFKPGQIMSFKLIFSESVNVTGSPKIRLDIEGNIRYALYASGTGTNTLRFNYTVDAANALLDLNGVNTDTSMDLTTGTITDLAGNAYTGSFSFSEIDYIHYTGMVGRYHITSQDISTSACHSGLLCATQVRDLAGSNHLNYNGGTTIGPIVHSSGFGTGNTGYLEFEQRTTSWENNSLKFSQSKTIKYVFIVVKTPTNPSNTAGVMKDFLLLRRYDYTTSNERSPFLFSSSGTSGAQNRYLFYDYQTSPYKGGKSRWNANPWDTTYASMKNFVWMENSTAIYSYDYENPQIYYSNSSKIGGYKNASNTGGFNGQLAEFIYMTTDTDIDATKLDQIVNQLNGIHGAY